MPVWREPVVLFCCRAVAALIVTIRTAVSTTVQGWPYHLEELKDGVKRVDLPVATKGHECSCIENSIQEKGLHSACASATNNVRNGASVRWIQTRWSHLKISHYTQFRESTSVRFGDKMEIRQSMRARNILGQSQGQW